MITNLNVIVKEWAYRVHDGKPDPNKSAHLYHLSESSFNDSSVTQTSFDII